MSNCLRQNNILVEVQCQTDILINNYRHWFPTWGKFLPSALLIIPSHDDDENIWQKYTTPFVSKNFKDLKSSIFKHVDTNMKSSWLKHHVDNHLLMWPYYTMVFTHLHPNIYTFWLKDHLNRKLWSDLDNRVLKSSQSDDECILIIFKNTFHLKDIMIKHFFRFLAESKLNLG